MLPNTLSPALGQILRTIAVVLASASSQAIAQKGQGIEFDLPVLPGVERHLELLTMPAYLALALDNVGLSPSVSSQLTIRDRETVQIKAGIVRYVGRQGAVFQYEVGVNLLGESSLTVRTEVDTSKLALGTVVLRVYPSLARLIPEQVIEKIDFKVRVFGEIRAQQRALAYLDRIAKEQRSKGRGLDGILEAIAFDAHNKVGVAAPAARTQIGQEPQPAYGRTLLLTVVACWIIGFPVFLYFLRTRRREERPQA